MCTFIHMLNTVTKRMTRDTDKILRIITDLRKFIFEVFGLSMLRYIETN